MLIYMFIFSFIFQYVFMSLIMSNKLSNITNSISKFYLSCIMALSMVIFELLMQKDKDVILILILLLFLFIFIYLYRNQIFINDNDYLREMIEHHSMALLTSKNIIEKTKDKKIMLLANNIIKNQQSEIALMNSLLK